MLGLFSLLALGAPANNGHHDLSPAPNEAHHSSASALALLNGKLMLNSGSPAPAYVQRLYEEAVAESNETYVAEMLDGTVHAEGRLQDAINNMRNERNQAVAIQDCRFHRWGNLARFGPKFRVCVDARVCCPNDRVDFPF